MSLALYRKYRPATFAELKGQEHVAEPLQQALRNGRIHHAYLFSGPRGCGKTSSARILARSLNCEQGPTPEPCGTCESCIALGASGSGHIDVIEIDAASHGGVDDARDLRERAFFAPVAARYKIYIIDEAHMVTREGFNALLKLVEEPPSHLKFIFATTEPEKVIGTIRSRTHHYPFRLIPPGTLRELLEEILQKEDVPYEPAAIPLVVRAGAGSARDSESILDQLLAGAGEEGITYARAVSLLGYTDATLLDEVVDAVAARDGGAVFAAIDRVMEGGQDPRRFAADLLERFRDLVILSNVPDSGATGLLNVPPDELERMQAQASRLGPAELSRAADLLHTGLTEMRGATAPRLLLELICARILLPGAYDDEASLLARLDRLERRLAIGDGTPAAEMPPVRRPQPPAPARALAEERRPQTPAHTPRADLQRDQNARPADGPQSPPGGRPTPEAGQPGSTRASAQRPPASTQPPPANTQPPPAQGGDPTSIVQRGGMVGEGARGAVDNSAVEGERGLAQESSQRSSPAGSSPGDARSRSAAAAESWEAASGSRGGRSSREDSRGSGADGSSSGGAGGVDWPAPAQPGGAHPPAGTPQSGATPQSAATQQPGSTHQPGGMQQPGGTQQHAGAREDVGSRQDASGRQEPTASQPGGVDVGAIRRMWVDILEAVKQRSKVAWIVLMEGVEVASLEGNVLTLAFANEGKRRGFTTGGKEVVLQEALKEILGVDWRIDAILEGGSGQSGRKAAPPPPDDGGWGGATRATRATGAPGATRATRATSTATATNTTNASTPAPRAPHESHESRRPPEARSAPERTAPPPRVSASGIAVPPPSGPMDEADEVDPEGDADAGADAALTGMALIEQVLGGKVIQEIDNA